jgi:hypothetical protein
VKTKKMTKPENKPVPKMVRKWVPVRNQMLVSLRGGGGELGNLKTLTYGFTNFTQR